MFSKTQVTMRSNALDARNASNAPCHCSILPSAIGVPEQMFGSSGLLERPERGPLESYYKCFPRDHQENCHVKTIANLAHTDRAGPDPHHFLYKDGYWAVNEQGERVKGPKSEGVHIDQVGTTLSRLFPPMWNLLGYISRQNVDSTADDSANMRNHSLSPSPDNHCPGSLTPMINSQSC